MSTLWIPTAPQFGAILVQQVNKPRHGTTRLIHETDHGRPVCAGTTHEERQLNLDAAALPWFQWQQDVGNFPASHGHAVSIRHTKQVYWLVHNPFGASERPQPEAIVEQLAGRQLRGILLGKLQRPCQPRPRFAPHYIFGAYPLFRPNGHPDCS